MKSSLIFSLFLLLFSVLSDELNLPVRPDTQQKLSFSLQRLAEELEYFRSPFENKTNLYKRVAQVEQYLQEVTSQVTDFDNVIRGKSNRVGGTKNVIVGNYNTLRGSNNYVFIENYTGQANGDLLVGKWRIEIEKKMLILINSSFAISFINSETNRKYLRYLTESRKFTLGSNSADNTVTIFTEDSGTTNDGFSFGSSGQSFGSSGQTSQVRIGNNRLTIRRNSPQPSLIPTRPSSPFSTTTSGPGFQSVRQTVISPNQQLVQASHLTQSEKTGQVINIFDSNRVQPSPTLTYNLRSQLLPTDKRTQGPMRPFRIVPQTVRIPTTAPSHQAVTTFNSAPSEQAPINLASWRNRT